MKKGILIIQSMGLGDAIFSLPAIEAVQNTFPGEPVDILTNTLNQGLFQLLPNIRAVLAYKKDVLHLFFQLLPLVRKKQYQRVFVLNPIFKGSLIAWASGASERFSYRTDFENKQSLYGLEKILLTKTFEPAPQKIHEVARYLDLVKMAGCSVKNSIPKIPKSETLQKLAEKIFRNYKFEAPKPLVLINTGAGWSQRLWPAEKLEATANLLQQMNCQIVLIGGPADLSKSKQIQSKITHPILNLTGKLSIQEVSALLLHSDLFISSDTGMLHVADALERPSIGLFGPSDLIKFSPSTKQVRTLFYPMPCNPCKVQYTDRCQSNLCMQQISVEEVISLASQILQKEIPAPQKEPARFSKRYKILYIQSTAEIGGSDITLLRTIQALDKTRFEPHLLVPGEGPLHQAFVKAGCKIHTMPSMRKLSKRLGFHYLMKYFLGYFPTVLKIKTLIQKEQIDLIHTNTIHNLYGFLAATLSARPHIWHIREIVLQSRLMWKIEEWLVRHFSNRFLLMSNAIAEPFLERTGGFPKNALKIYDGVDLSAFSPDISGKRIRESLGLGSEVPLVGMITRLDPWKGVDRFLEIAALISKQNPQVRFLICGGEIEGHPGYERELKELSQKLGLQDRVIFSGWQFKGSDIPEVYRALQVAVQCPRLPEPYGLACLEANASGIPLVAERRGGPAELLLNEKTGILVAPNDFQAFAAAVLDILKNPKKAESLGREGRLRAEHIFDYRICTQQLETIYQKVLNE